MAPANTGKVDLDGFTVPEEPKKLQEPQGFQGDIDDIFLQFDPQSGPAHGKRAHMPQEQEQAMPDLMAFPGIQGLNGGYDPHSVLRNVYSFVPPKKPAPTMDTAAQPSALRQSAEMGMDFEEPWCPSGQVESFGQQQEIPGWPPAAAQHQHHPSFGSLEHHAAQYGGQQQHPSVLAPPHLHRGSSDDNISPTSTSHNPRVPIERQQRGSLPSSLSSPEEQSPDGVDKAMVVQQSGPMSSSVTVPSRPRPGRKPIPQENAADRRRLQNRIAQRNFRDKRQLKLQETQAELEERKREYLNGKAEMSRTLDEFRRANRDLEQRLAAQETAHQEQMRSVLEKIESFEQRNRELEKKLQDAKSKQQQQVPSSLANFRPIHVSSTHSTVSQPKDLSTPPGSEGGMEIDYTNFGRNTQSGYANDSNQMDYSLQTDDHCGFCTDSQNCQCAQDKAAAAAKAAAAEKAVPVSVPGSCDQCRADPVRAQACRDMAASTRPAARTPISNSARALGVSTSISMPPPPRTTCSSMVDSFNKYGERTSSISSLFGGRLTTYPAPNGGGYEFEEKQAAEVLSNLSRRSTMAESPRTVVESPKEPASPHSQ